MNKNKFLTELNKRLQLLNDEEREEIIGFYEERFEKGVIYEGKSEKDVIAELETPEVIANNVLEEYGFNSKFVSEQQALNSEPQVTPVVIHNNNNSNANLEHKLERIENKLDNEAQHRNQNMNNQYHSNYPTNKSTFGSRVPSIILLIWADILVFSWLLTTILAVSFSLLAVPFATLVSSVTVLLPQATTYDWSSKVAISVLLVGITLVSLLIVIILIKWSIKFTAMVINLHYNVITGRRGKNVRFPTIGHKKSKLLRLFGTLGIIVSMTGIVLVAVNHQDIREKFIMEPTEVLTYEEEIDIAGVFDLNLDIDSSKVNINYHDEETVKIVYTKHEQRTNRLTFDIGEDTINVTHTFKWEYILDSIGLQYYKDEKITVYLPNDIKLETLNLNAWNADFDFDLESFSNGTIKNVDIHTSNGDINIQNGNLEKLSLYTSNGNVTVKNVVANRVVVSTSNGKIRTTNITTDFIDIHTSNGDVEVTAVNEKSNGTIMIYTSNGEVDVRNSYIKNVDIHTSNGDISYKNDEDFTFNNVKITTSNGDVDRLRVPLS